MYMFSNTHTSLIFYFLRQKHLNREKPLRYTAFGEGDSFINTLPHWSDSPAALIILATH
jgi:hypothetical protein